MSEHCLWLRDQIRSGKLNPLAYQRYTEEVYHLERRAEGVPDGPEYWYEARL